MKPHPAKSRPRKAKPSPRQPAKGGRVMWAVSREKIDSGDWFVIRPDKSGIASWCCQVPVLVLDLSDKAREQRVEAVATAMAAEHGETLENSPCDYRVYARAVLTSIGDTPAGEGRGK